MARRRTRSAADADDVVAEALTRAMERPDIDLARLGPWLNVVTQRLCIDLARAQRRRGLDEAYTRRMQGRPPTPEDVVLARAHAEEIRSRLDRLPSRQREAVLLRGSGLSVGEVAERMGVSYKVAEGLLDRARAALRRLLRAVTRPLLAWWRGTDLSGGGGTR